VNVLALSDAQLVNRAKKGNTDAVGDLFDRHHRSIFRFVWSQVQDEQLAEDLTSEVFIRMVNHLPAYRLTEVPFRAWLYRIARNLIVDQHRLENGRLPTPLDNAKHIAQPGQDPAAIAENQLTLDQIGRALAQLEPSQRDVIALRFLADMSLREVAETLEKSIAAIKSIQHRALATLRARLKQDKVNA
jgi:RNA polymerase sigma-70 factor (ECF subfamily)